MGASSAARRTEAGSMGCAPCKEYSQTEVRSSMSTRCPGKSVRIMNNAQSVGHFLNLYVGLHGRGWLYWLGMPPRVYRCAVGEFTATGVPLFLFAFLVSSREIDGKAEGRWLGTSPCDNERTFALRSNALRVNEGKSSAQVPPGPRS